MLKKCLTVIMALLIALISAATSVAANVTDITVNIDIYTVTVSATVDVKGDYPLKVYRTVDGIPEAAPVYLGQTETEPTACEEIIEEGASERVITLYTYTFAPFDLDILDKSGTYLAVVGEQTAKAFTFINKQDKIAFYNNLSSASQNEVNGVLNRGIAEGLIGFDIGNYLSYDDKIRAAFDATLASFELPVLSADATDEEIRTFESLLEGEFARLLQAGDLVSANSETFHSAVEKADLLNLDLTYYNDEELNLPSDAVQSRMKGLIPQTFSQEEVQNAFDLAVLLAMLDKADYGSVTQALQHYDGKCITLSKTHTSDFDSVDFNTLSSRLKANASEISSASQLEQKYDEIAEEIADEKEDPEGGGSTASGSGSGGGSFGGGSRGNGSSPNNGVSGVVTDPAVPITSPDVSQNTAAFNDLGTVGWAVEAINYLSEKGVLNGKEEGKFSPDDLVTREEFVKMIVESLHILDDNAKANFSDVAEDRWSYAYIASGVAAKIINGISDLEFAPGATITRQDMAVITYRCAQLIQLDLSGSANFNDENAVSDYARNAVSSLAGAGIINGVGDGNFAPKSSVTRAQAAKIVYELVMANGGIK